MGFLQPRQRGLHLHRSCYGVDVNVIAHKIAQQPGVGGDVVEGDHGHLAGTQRRVRQFQGTQQVVHGHLNLNDRQGQILPEHFSGAAPGDDHIVVSVEVVLGDLQAFFHVAHKQRQIY